MILSTIAKSLFLMCLIFSEGQDTLPRDKGIKTELV
jgi:hypothetical protein